MRAAPHRTAQDTRVYASRVRVCAGVCVSAATHGASACKYMEPGRSNTSVTCLSGRIIIYEMYAATTCARHTFSLCVCVCDALYAHLNALNGVRCTHTHRVFHYGCVRRGVDACTQRAKPDEVENNVPHFHRIVYTSAGRAFGDRDMTTG